MSRVFLAIILACIMSFRLSAQDYSVGDIFEKEGITYKVVVTYLVTDSKESPDIVSGPDKFYRAGELMAIKVSKKLNDVVIPPAVGRYKVIGLADSLFYGHEHERIWLPDLMFAGNGCFAKLKMKTGALVIHDIDNFGTGVFDDLDADLILETTTMSWGKSFRKMREDSTYVPCQPKGDVKTNTKMLAYIKRCPMYDNCYSATSKNYKKWIDKAFKNDEEFQQNPLKDKNAFLSKRNYSTTTSKAKKGLTITAGVVNVKNMDIPWGSLARDYYREPRYTVLDKKKRKTHYYSDFIPVADAMQKEGWHVEFVGKDGIVKYTLNGKIIKE